MNAEAYGIRKSGFALLFAFLFCPLSYAQENVSIRGMGFLGNIRLENRLSFLHGQAKDDTTSINAAFLEDTAFMLLQQVKLDGFLRPAIVASFQTASGARTFGWQEPYEPVLSADFTANKAVFRMVPGILYFYNELDVRGIDVIPEKEVRRYFIPSGALFLFRSDLAFTEKNLRQRSSRLLRQLHAMGYLDACLVDRHIEIAHGNGAVDVRLHFQQGPQYRVRNVVVRTYRGGEFLKEQRLQPELGMDTVDWNRDMRQNFMNAAYVEGYPDVRVHEEVTNQTVLENGSVVERDYRFTVQQGEQATIREIRMEGRPDVNVTILRRHVELERGSLLNYLEVAEGRRKIMALGVFREVRLRLGEPDEEGRRDVVYTMKPGRRQHLSILAGWGSYELARVGFRWEHINPFHRAHRYELKAKRSIKTTDVRTTYSVPQVFGTELTAYSRLNYLYREEISFDREKTGITVGATLVPGFLSGVLLNLEYGMETQKTFRDGVSFFQTRDSARVASLGVLARLERVDHALFPTQGYRLVAESETASSVLGGDVDFQKIEMGSAYHYPITETLIFHLGLRYGAIFSWEPDTRNIPFSERFFLGGENSIRGFRRGGASPQDATGERIGAETYLLGNSELEQRVVGDFSVVIFYDAANMSAGEKGITDGVYMDSVGAGVSYRSIVGPVRLEYGYNLNRAPGDPVGTLHFAFGFPF